MASTTRTHLTASIIIFSSNMYVLHSHLRITHFLLHHSVYLIYVFCSQINAKHILLLYSLHPRTRNREMETVATCQAVHAPVAVSGAPMQASTTRRHRTAYPTHQPRAPALAPSRCVALTDGARRLFRLQCSDAMAPGACPRRQAWRSAGRRGMQGATRRDAIARPTATPACGATAARTWKWNGACRLPRNCPVSRRRRARPRRDRERTHGQKGHILAASQVRAGAVVAIANRYLRVRPADTWFRSRIGRQDKGDSGRGGHGGGGGGGAPVHCALRSDVTAANMLTWEPVRSDGPFHARIREAAALMLVRL